MTATEWGKQLLPLFSFIPLWEISGPSQSFVLKRERQCESGRPRVGITGDKGIDNRAHYLSTSEAR
jgi:hypothetical protein